MLLETERTTHQTGFINFFYHYCTKQRKEYQNCGYMTAVKFTLIKQLSDKRNLLETKGKDYRQPS